MNKIILYIATSEDGFIADKNGGVDWLPQPPEEAGDTVGYQALLNRVSSLFMGRQTYEQVLTFGDWAWPGKMTYVFTSQQMTSERDDICFVRQTIPEFREEFLCTEREFDIWLMGGAQLAKSFSDLGLIDEYIVTIVPQTLGEGMQLELDLSAFNLVKTQECGEGIIQKTFTHSKCVAI